ncbi:Asp23/Gls24 family envelope stress response protein [Alkaliphilus hydrothermalis]|uniref:Alkaline shock family protein YloU n=1 Tax=Alkaliphilus hydrothermalis TaxID=1482730 RepID=A0ABS2NQM9_9FIRM|nr:Asp23/Gls24 family envelope stress response protein [Alkaliphilus hydrothermalis]MBM7615254.1 putative alkaline shock family protein YloU [Alkaliphilus hydrothermalis]
MAKNAMELSAEQGNIKISNDVIMVITQKAIEEVKGIVSFSSGLSKGFTEAFSRKNNSKKAVKIDNEEKLLEINISVVVEYGIVIPELMKTVQEKVKQSIENMTDIDVDKVNVYVQDVKIS